MEKINIAELLKDCPKGMELDCTMFDNVYFDKICDDKDDIYLIRCYIVSDGVRNTYSFTKYGGFNTMETAKCVIFPKGKTTWDGFVPPCKFKDGNIIAMENECGIHIFIYNYTTNEYNGYGYYVIFTSLGNFKINGFCSGSTYRLATEEEKQKLFDAIKANGYKWNTETKTLEKLIEPKFKVGDRIKKGEKIATIVRIYENFYDVRFDNGIGSFTIDLQDEWELAPNKFDITTLIPFESKVLVRGDKNSYWKPAIFGCYMKSMTVPYYALGGTCWRECIPYEGNGHLLGTNNDCDDYYKTWE